MIISGSDFLEYPALPEDIEAAYRIATEIQNRGLLKVKANHKEGEETFIQWEINTDKAEQN